jgi:trans-aconitate methyltransferase
VLSRWQKDGCFGEIEARLGYRLVLKDVHYDALQAGKKCKVTIRLYNKGFAAPMNPREAWLVWVTPSGTKEKTLLGADPRNWHPGYNAVVASFTPSTAKGALYLEFPDPLLPDRPEYSIALANKNVFDDKTGLNKLFEVK